MYEKGRAWIELNQAHLRHNLQVFQELLPGKCLLMPAVKANAYGHGAVWMGRALQQMGVRHYCVACVAEGMELRKAGIKGEILVLGYTHPKDLDQLREYGLTQTIVDYAYGKELASYGKELQVHVGIDTGMHRLGEDSGHFSKIRGLWEFENLRITGVFSHLCTSDGVSRKEQEFVRLQEQRFLQVVRRLRAEGKKGFATHLQGSYGILHGANLSGHYQYARAGIALYGALSEPSKPLRKQFVLKPVLALKARITCVREVLQGEGAGYGLAWRAKETRKIAAVSIGYADGIPRTLSNQGCALIRGEEVPVVGRVCMDQLLLDVTKVSDVCPGEIAVFIGKSQDREIRVEEMAKRAGTISNEILSGLGDRLCRIAV